MRVYLVEYCRCTCVYLQYLQHRLIYRGLFIEYRRTLQLYAYEITKCAIAATLGPYQLCHRLLANFLDHQGLVRVHMLVENVIAMGILLYLSLHFDKFLRYFVAATPWRLIRTKDLIYGAIKICYNQRVKGQDR